MPSSFITVSSADSINFGTGDFSICFWLYEKGNYDAYVPVFFHKKTDGGIGWYLEGSAGIGVPDTLYPILALHKTGGDLIGHINPPEPDTVLNVWNFYAFTVDRDGNGLGYSNGVVGTATDISADAAEDLDNVEDLYIGGITQDAVGLYFNGYMDDIRIHKKVLTANEILAIYNNGNGTRYSGFWREGGTASAVWSFDEGSGTTVRDRVNGLEGTINGNAEWSAGGVPFDSIDAKLIKLIGLSSRVHNIYR